MADLITKLAGLIRLYPPKMDEDLIRRTVASFLKEREVFIGLSLEHGSPLYVLDGERARARARKFRRVFEKHLNDVSVFFAMKSNNMPEIARMMVEEGVGLDVSSGLELQRALEAGAKETIFSGPGKTDEELIKAIDHADRVTILMDSFGELRRLDRLTQKRRGIIKCGVRLNTNPAGLWRKFGIPLQSLRFFLSEARSAPFVRVSGLQFHTSWNRSPSAQVRFISELGKTLRDLPGDLLESIEFLDIGGGFWPEEGEWLRAEGTSFGRFMSLLFSARTDTSSRFLCKSSSLDVFAIEIAEALEKALPRTMDCKIYMEPGRWLSHQAMHLLMTVVDVKSPDLVITDSGTNAIGWERFEQDYFPVINLTHPGPEEHACAILGSLCTPHDVWGYSYHGTAIHPGDLLLIPNQGAYTYSLRQDFIKSLPRLAVLPNN
jgi:diaminopimelate decarboxylase